MNKIILAMPNSASESLMQCINADSDHKCDQITNVNMKNHILNKYNKNFSRKIFALISYFINRCDPTYNNNLVLRNFSPSAEYSYLSNYHNDIASFTPKTSFIINQFKGDKFIAKQHIPPTLSNKIYFTDWKKIILTRPPEEIINKYQNREKDKLVLHKTYRENIVQELKNWEEGWKNENNTILITKKQLTTDTYQSLLKISEFANINFHINENYKLPHII